MLRNNKTTGDQALKTEETSNSTLLLEPKKEKPEQTLFTYHQTQLKDFIFNQQTRFQKQNLYEFISILSKDYQYLLNSRKLVSEHLTSPFDPFVRSNVVHTTNQLVCARNDKTQCLCLTEILVNIFKYNYPKNDTINRLSETHFQIFKCMLKRKFELVINDKKVDFHCIIKKQLNARVARHRKEEKYKFIFKKGLKYLEDKFIKTLDKKPISKTDLQIKFFKHYFEEDFKTYEIPYYYVNKELDGIYRLKNISLFKCRTITHNYIRLTIISKLFRKEFSEYLENVFAASYCQQELTRKMETIVRNCTKMAKEKKDFQRYILEDHKFKIPWTIKELVEAKNLLNSLIQKLILQINEGKLMQKLKGSIVLI